jgi:hypothetical protein
MYTEDIEAQKFSRQGLAFRKIEEYEIEDI